MGEAVTAEYMLQPGCAETATVVVLPKLEYVPTRILPKYINAMIIATASDGSKSLD